MLMVVPRRVRQWVMWVGLALLVLVGWGVAVRFTHGGTAPAGRVDHAPVRSAAEVEYLRAVGELDPGLVVNEDRALRRAEQTCADIAGGLRGEALYQRVMQRMSGGNATVDRDTAALVVAVAERTVC